MQLRWLGHSSFFCQGSGVRLLTDPCDERVGYRRPEVTADLVTISHDHYDHNAADALPGHPLVIRETGEHRFRGITVSGWPTFHDARQGAERGPNVVFCWEMDGLRLCHLGDLGHLLSPETVAAIGRVDLLMIPVGGVYTIDAAAAVQVAEQLQPRLVLPMHYQTPALRIRLGKLQEFTAQFSDVRELPELDLTAETLDSAPRVAVLDYPQ